MRVRVEPVAGVVAVKIKLPLQSTAREHARVRLTRVEIKHSLQDRAVPLLLLSLQQLLEREPAFQLRMLCARHSRQRSTTDAGSIHAQCGATRHQHNAAEARDQLYHHPGRHPASRRAALAWLRLRLWLRLL